jgi:hypothetical protein
LNYGVGDRIHGLVSQLGGYTLWDAMRNANSKDELQNQTRHAHITYIGSFRNDFGWYGRQNDPRTLAFPICPDRQSVILTNLSLRNLTSMLVALTNKLAMATIGQFDKPR